MKLFFSFAALALQAGFAASCTVTSTNSFFDSTWTVISGTTVTCKRGTNNKYGCYGAQIQGCTEVYCDGGQTCRGAQITGADTVTCNGGHSCYATNIVTATDVYCGVDPAISTTDPNLACQYANIQAVHVECLNDRDCLDVTITGNDCTTCHLDISCPSTRINGVGPQAWLAGAYGTTCPVATIADIWTVEAGVLTENVGGASGVYNVKFDHAAGDKGDTDAPEPFAVFEIFSRASGPDAANPNSACYSSGVNTTVNEGNVLTGVTGFALEGSGLQLYGPGTTADFASDWTFSMNSDIQSIPNIYAYDAATEEAIIHFCVRFGLTSTAFSGEVVNYREIAIVATVDLSTDFDVTSVASTTPDAVVDGSNTIAYSVTAKVCDNAPESLIPGAEVPLCVCSDSYPQASVSSIDSLVFLDGTYMQQSVDGGVITNNLAADQGCFVSEITGEQCCQVDTLLRAGFYTGPSTPVRVQGSATLSVGGARRLVHIDRSLEAKDESAAFETSIVLEKDSSSASTNAATFGIAFCIMAAGLVM